MKLRAYARGAACLASLCVAGGAAGHHAPAPDLSSTELKATLPYWEKKPTADDFVKEYPAGAKLHKISGSATISCKSDPAGKLHHCVVVSEAPAGYGFGAATLRMAKYFKLHPAWRDGKPIAGQITVPLNWQIK